VQWVELMREYGWSWPDLEATPPYVRRVSWDLMVARREAQQRADERQGGGVRA
jgi:hypothetical protein